MAWIDIASPSSYGRFNVKFAHIAGLESAVYWSEILNVLDRVKEKKACDIDGWFILNREYIKNRTTFTVSKQQECEDILKQLEIIQISPDNPNRIRCDVKTFVKLIAEDDISTVKEIKAISKQAEREAKQQAKKTGIVMRLLNRTHESEEVTKKIEQWLNVVYHKGFLQNERMDLFMEELNQFTSDDSVKIELLNIGIEKAYSRFDWIRNIYSRSLGTKKFTDTKVATKLSDIEL